LAGFFAGYQGEKQQFRHITLIRGEEKTKKKPPEKRKEAGGLV